MKRYAVLVRTLTDSYGIGPFDELETARAYIAQYLQDTKVQIVGFYEPLLPLANQGE